jgi:enoyl-CoA hydratase/carnithine racemase
MQAGPGVENSFGAVAQAYAEGVPLLVVPGGSTRAQAWVTPAFNAALNFQHVTKWAEQVNDPATIVAAMRRAFTQARNGRPGPVLLEIPADVWSMEVEQRVKSEFRAAVRRPPMEPGAAPETDFLHVETDDGIATVWMEKPPVNAVSLAMFKEFPPVFGWLADREDVAVVVLASRVRHFCAGTDLNDFEAMTVHTVEERNQHVRAAFFAVDDCPLPTIASVHGACLGSGVALAGSCDMVVAAREAKFGTPEVSVGVMGGAHHLSRLVPQNVMRKMYFTADPVPATELAGYGGIVALADAEELPRVTPRARGEDRAARPDGAAVRQAHARHHRAHATAGRLSLRAVADRRTHRQ